MHDTNIGYLYDDYIVPRHLVDLNVVRAVSSRFTRGRIVLSSATIHKEYVTLPRFFPRLPTNFEFVDLRPDPQHGINWSCVATQRSEDERRAWEAMKAADHGILQLACGKGKTVHALNKIALTQGPACVFVNSTQLIGQWKERAIQFLRLDGRELADDDIGVVGMSSEQWDRPITLVLLHAAAKMESIPNDIRERFPLVVYDECHHLVAPTWLPLANFGLHQRIGLSATPRNEAGSHDIYMQHIGEVFYEDLNTDQIPTCVFVKMQTPFDIRKADVWGADGLISFGRLNRALGFLPRRNSIILQELQKCYDAGRKILILSHSVEHCYLLRDYIIGAGLCIGEIDVVDRMRALKESRVIIATNSQIAKEGLDQPDIDTLFIVTPFSGRFIFQQVVGRILRPMGLPPRVYTFVDANIKVSADMCNKLRGHAARAGYPIETVVYSND